MAGYTTEVLSDSPTLFLMMDASSGNLTDLANGLTATKSGSPTYGVAGPITGYTAIDFPTSSDYFTVSDNDVLDLGSGDLSIEWWMARDTDTDAWEVILSKDAGGYEVAIEPTGYPSIEKSGILQLAYRATTVPTDGSWHHYVWTVSGSPPTTGGYKIYVDGQLATTGFETFSQYIADTTGALYIAHSSGDPSFLGKLAGIALYNSALSAARIAAHYTAAKSTVLATGTGTAYAPSNNAETADAQCATSTATAYGASTGGSTYQANAGVASGTGTALAPTSRAAAFQHGAFQGDTFDVEGSPTISVVTVDAIGIGTAHSATTSHPNPLGVASGTGTAYAPTEKVGVRPPALAPTATLHAAHVSVKATSQETASATGAAYPVTARVGFVGAAIAATGTANNATATSVSGMLAPAGLAEATGTAPTSWVRGDITAIATTAGTGTAYATLPSVGAVSALPAVTVTVHAATAVTVSGTYGSATEATGTGTALQASIRTGATPQLASGTGTATGPSASLTGTLGTSSGTAATYDARTGFGAFAGVAVAVGTALPVSFSLRASGGIADPGTGQALAGSTALSGTTGYATAMGSARDVTWSSSSTGSATAGVATASATARGTRRGGTGGTPPRGRGHHWKPRGTAAPVS